MFNDILHGNKKIVIKLIVALITLSLFFVPFFWLKPGEMDIGGDSSRLYFYDPKSFLTNVVMWGVSPSDFGGENISYYAIPYVFLIYIVKFIFQSPTILISINHGINLSISFLTIYLIVFELLKENFSKRENILRSAAIIAGLLYVFSPGSILGWSTPLITRNQFFLNTLMFFLLLKYFKTTSVNYLVIILLTSFVFSPNFSFAAAPGFFAFYPLSILFLFIYRLVFLKRKFVWKHIFALLILFILLQLFHILPQLVSMLSSGSVLNSTIFSNEGKFDRGLNYFLAIAPNIKASVNIMGLPQMTELSSFSYFFIIFPVIILFGFLFSRTKIMSITGIFFLIVLFFSTANITQIGFEIYKKMFIIPGFSIFRNFYGQWGYTLLFFYTILFGQALATVLLKLKLLHRYILSIFLVLLLIISSVSFINGSLVNKEIWQSKNRHIFVTMDPKYKETINFVRSLPVDAKILTLPLTDPGYQIIAGTNNGAYQGPSTISYLAGKQDFAGLLEFGNFGDTFAELVKNKQYKELNELLGFLNIKYIFYNADPHVYDTTFPAFPYIEARKKLPTTQKEYKEFLDKLSLKQIKNIGNKYYIFETNEEFYQSRIFTSQDMLFFTKSLNNWFLPFSFKEYKKQTIFLDAPQIPPVFSEALTELDKQSIYSQIVKNPDPPRFLYNAFAKTEPTSIFYKPSVVKEYIDLQKKGDSSLYVGKRMFLSAKLLYEFEVWGHGMPLFDHSSSTFTPSPDIVFNQMKRMDQKRTLLWELQHANNSWESLLTRYVRNLVESIDYINKSNESPQWKLEQKFLLNEYYLNHRQRFDNIIDGSNMSKKEGKDLKRLLNDIYYYWLDELKLPDLLKAKNEYALPVIEDNNLTKSLYIKKDDFEKLDKSQFGLKIEGQEVEASNDQDENQWIKLNSQNVDFSKQNTLEIFTKSFKNLLSTADLISLQPSISPDILSEVKIKNGLVWKINDWKPNNYYLLSFEYNNPDVPCAVKVYEDISFNKRQTTNQLLKDQIRSDKWVNYQAVIKSDKDAKTAFLQLERTGTDNSLSGINIRNISLTYLPQPQLFLKTVNIVTKEKQLPNIFITKINPTKYSVLVKNSKDPYYLVLNQSFNKRWKVFLDGGNSKSLFDNEHYAVNGDMNGWYIDTKKLENKKSYSIALEFTTQRYFYTGFIISFITFISIIIYLIYRVLKK